MTQPLGSDEEIWRLVDQVKEPFGHRDTKWADRRHVRYRQMDQELASMPLNPRIKDTALMVYQSEVPNQEIHKRVKRLVANPPRAEIVVFDDDQAVQELGQELEDGVKAYLRWNARGKTPFDWKVTQFQQGDGLGIGKLIWVPGHGDVLGFFDEDDIQSDLEDAEDESVDDEARRVRRGRNIARVDYQKVLDRLKDADEESKHEKAFAEVTDAALKREVPPVRMTAVDPLSCYWWEDEDGVEVMVETGKRSLNPLLSAFKDYGLKLTEDGSRLYVGATGDDVVSSMTSPPDRTAKDLSQEVQYTEVRTRTQIAILIEHPKITEKSPKEGGPKGIVLRFDNPFGPYTTGYALVPADETTEVDPADKYQPPALAAIVAAQPQNVLMTAQLSAALEDALAPPYVEVGPDQVLPPSDEDKTPEIDEGQEVPFVPGKMRRVESPSVDLAKIDERIAIDGSVGAYREVLEGGAQSEASGHRLAVQVAQADIQLVPYQNTRKAAIEELLMGLLYAIRRHGLTIFIPAIPDGPRSGRTVKVSEYAKLTPEMADMDFQLIITLGAETPTTKFAKEQHLRDMEEAGFAGYESVMEQVAENVDDEISRVFEGKMLKDVMTSIMPTLTQALTDYLQAKLEAAAGQPPVPPGGGQQLPFETPPETGLAGGGGSTGTEDDIRLPGVNMPVVQSPEGVPEPTSAAQVPL